MLLSLECCFKELCALTAVPLHAGVVLPLLQQSILIWQVSLGYLILGKRLTPAEVCLLA